MKAFKILLVATIIIVAPGCERNNNGPSEKSPKQIELTGKAADVILKSNDFGVDLFKAVATDDAGENLMLSPLSASAALTMLLNGCDNTTYNQIRDMLGYENLTIDEINEAYSSLIVQLLTADEQVELSLANAVWYRQGFQVKPSYLEAMQNDFGAHIQGLDFSAPSALVTMNQWASDNTNGKIDHVIDEISAEAVLFLMNALYFKGMWTAQFKAENTFAAPFLHDDGTSTNVPTMHGLIPVKAIEDDDCRAVELFYGRKNFSMVIVVPDEDIETFVQNLDAAKLHGITGSLDDQLQLMEMDVSLPKFSFEYEKRLNDQLAALGMTDAFNPGIADLSKIADAGLFVSFVKQNTFVDVNEEGTEAAAVTTIGVELTSVMEQFVVDKPFLFAIREQTTNTMLFIGQVFNP